MINKWLDENTWFQKGDILYKKMVFSSLNMLSSFNNTKIPHGVSLNILFKDVDVTCYILSQFLFQSEDLLKFKELKSHLNNEKKAKYILSKGCLDNIVSYCLKKHPKLLYDKDIIKYYAQYNPRTLNFFSKSLENRELVDELIKENLVSQELLKLYPQDTLISKGLIKKGIFPNSHNKHLFSLEIYKNITLIKKALNSDYGYMLYSFLPESLQVNEDICDIVEKKHPHTNVKTSKIKNIDDFMQYFNSSADFATELYTLTKKMSQYSFIIDNPHNLLQIFEALTDGSFNCYVDLMGDPCFDSHPVQNLFKNINNEIIKQFINSGFGKKMVDYHISSYSDFTAFEKNIIPQIYYELKSFIKIYEQMNHLENKLTIKENNKNITKI